MLKNKKLILKLFLAVGFAFVLSTVSMKEVFIAGTPQIRPNLGNYLASRLQFQYEKAKGSVLALIKNDSSYKYKYIEDHLKNLPMQPVVAGVYAKSEDGVAKVEYSLDEVQWVEYTFTLNDGRVIKVNVPKNQTPPPQNVIEKVYK